jgi:hypothetical protein
MKAIVAALMIVFATAPGLLVLLAPPADAQQFKSMGDRSSKDSGTDQKKKSNDDGHYKSAIERLPDKKFDPWANMR